MPLLVLVLIIIRALCSIFEDSLPKIAELKEAIQAAEVRNQVVEEKNNQLAHDIDDLKTEKSLLEEYARYHLGLIAPGEKLYKITC